VLDIPGIGSWLTRRADRTPAGRALVFEGAFWTYAELNDESDRVAAGLARRGVANGDRIAYAGVNHPAFLAVLFGCAKLGAIMTPVNWHLAAPEIQFILEDSGASGLIYDAPLAPVIEQVRAQLPDRFYERNDLAAKPVLPQLSVTTPRDVTATEASGEDVAVLMYTSGTQGRPKGAMITHRNLIASIVSLDCTFPVGPGHTALVTAPLFHIGGINVDMLTTFLKGGTVVLERSFDPGRTLRLIAEHGVNSFFGAPVMLRMIAAQPEFAETDLSSVRWVYSGAAPVNLDVVRAYGDRGIPVCNGYGMTEATPLISIVAPDEVSDRIGSAGRPGLLTDVRIVDQRGADVPPGTRGEILIRGANVISGYWNRPEVNAESFQDGWLHTGDIGVLSPDGYLQVVDRLKDMIISGGENVASAEVERCLLEHPAVTDAAVIGRAHEKWGEVPFAFVVLAPRSAATADELRAFAGMRLARFKQPAGIEIVETLPRSAAGKVLKQELRQRLAGPLTPALASQFVTGTQAAGNR
jgi:fatty-acyl-CoA synthase